MNEIKGFRENLNTEKEYLYGICFRIQKDNVDNHTSVSNLIFLLQKNLECKNKLLDNIVEKKFFLKVLKEKLDVATRVNEKMNEERLMVKSRNFEINRLLVKIVEGKDTPYVYYISQLMDAKLNLTLLLMSINTWMLSAILFLISLICSLML